MPALPESSTLLVTPEPSAVANMSTQEAVTAGNVFVSVLITFAALVAQWGLCCIIFSLCYRREPPRIYFLTTYNLLILAFTWPYHVYRLIRHLRLVKKVDAGNNDSEINRFLNSNSSSSDKPLPQLPTAFGPYGLSPVGPMPTAHRVFGSQPVATPSRPETTFTPQPLHSQAALRENNVQHKPDIAQAKLPPSHTAYLASLPFSSVPSDPSPPQTPLPSSHTAYLASLPFGSVSSSRYSTATDSKRTSDALDALDAEAMMSTVSFFAPSGAYLEDGRNVIGGENAEYFSSGSAVEDGRKRDPVEVPLPDSPTLPPGMHLSVDPGTLDVVPL